MELVQVWKPQEAAMRNILREERARPLKETKRDRDIAALLARLQ